MHEDARQWLSLAAERGEIAVPWAWHDRGTTMWFAEVFVPGDPVLVDVAGFTVAHSNAHLALDGEVQFAARAQKLLDTDAWIRDGCARFGFSIPTHLMGGPVEPSWDAKCWHGLLGCRAVRDLDGHRALQGRSLCKIIGVLSLGADALDLARWRKGGNEPDYRRDFGTYGFTWLSVTEAPE